MHNLENRSRLRITVVAQSTVQSFARYTRVSSHLRHTSPSSRHSTERFRDHTRIVALESDCQIGRDGFFVGKKVSSIVRYCFHSHSVTPHFLDAPPGLSHA